MKEQKQILLGLLDSICRKLIAEEEILTDLDAAIGDGDCGASIKKGFQGVLDVLPSLADASMGIILKKCGMALTSSIGGVSGAIYATAFMRAGKCVGDKDQLTGTDIYEALKIALEGVKERGEGTKVGDKTMVDALEPAIEAFGDAINNGDNIGQGLQIAIDAARKGSDSTIDLVAKKGRASYLGERSKGHRDAGSMVICFMFETANKFYKKEI